MKIQHLIQPAVWIATAFLVIAVPSVQAENGSEKKPPSEAQAILDSLNSERTSMLTEDGQLDPQEAEHVQRMIKLYELKAGFVDVDAAKRELGLTPKEQPEVAAQQQQSEQQNNVEQLRGEVVDLRQQLDELRSAADQPKAPVINDAAGAENYRLREMRSFRDRPRIP